MKNRYCNFCDRDFITNIALWEHYNFSKYHSDTYECEECSTCFATMEERDDCKICVQGLEPAHLLTSYYHDDDDQSPQYCGYCRITFKGPAQLAAHIRTRIHGANVNCPGCEAVFPTISAMTLHMEGGTCPSGANKKRVDQLMALMDTVGAITNSDRMQEDNREEYAEDIEIATERAWNGRAYACCVCSKGFPRLVDLDQHLRSSVHEMKKYHCFSGRGCGREFNALSALVQHIEAGFCGMDTMAAVQTIAGYEGHIKSICDQ